MSREERNNNKRLLMSLDGPKGPSPRQKKRSKAGHNPVGQILAAQRHTITVHSSRYRHLATIEPPSQKSARASDVTMFKRMADLHFETWVLDDAPACLHCGAFRFPGETLGFCCGSGKIKLPLPRMPPELWSLYVNDMTMLGENFRQRCRTYNNSLAFTSIRVTYATELASGRQGVYTFRIQGSIWHYIRDLIPKDGFPRHLQLYFYGVENEIEHRLSQSGGLDSAIIDQLVQMLRVNPYHNFFMGVRDLAALDTYTIMLRANPDLDPNTYNLPLVDHVAAIWNEGVGPSMEQPKDIRVNLKSGGVSFVHYYYGCYDPLQYVLLFPYGEPGWRAGIPKNMVATSNANNGEPADENLLEALTDPALHQQGETLLTAEQNNLSENAKKVGCVAMREFYCYLFQIRSTDVTNILRTGRLVQQFQIDVYVKLETQRLDFLRKNQSKLEIRAESYQNLIDSINIDGVTRTESVGQRVFLPTSFTGGPRDLRKRYMNALALVMEHGRPDFFITMTCNPKWVEIQRELLSTEKSHNRADLYARVFRAKNQELKKEIVENNLFGEVAAYFYVVEFQKRGLPHVHWLIIMKPKYGVQDNIDRGI